MKYIIMTAMLLSSPASALEIIVSKKHQEMIVIDENKIYQWKVSTGKKGFETPKGQWKPYLVKRMHYSRQYNGAEMPYSIFFYKGYAIHATKEINRLGRPASHGCVRLSLDKAEQLFKMIKSKDVVINITE